MTTEVEKSKQRERGLMNMFIKKALDAGRKYTMLDFALLKISLFSLGLLCGAYFTQAILRYTVPLWIAFIVSYIWIMHRTFFAHRD